MLLPYSTDAPIYHWPYVTVGLIVVNTVVFVGLVGMAPDFDAVQPYILEYGKGLQPHQWLTSNFLHAGPMHLIGNMLALWGFGLIVEGKIGWWRFLLIYFGIGIVQCMIEQTVTLGMVEGCSLGASAIIFGLIAMSLVWAPKNDVSCFLFIWLHPITFEMNITAYSALAFAMEVALLFLSGMAMSSAVLHLMGAALGLAVGIVMLKLDWVDCENWDLFSVRAGRHLMSRDQIAELKPKKKVDPKQIDQRRQAALAQVQQATEEGHYELAQTAHQKMSHTFDSWHLPEPHFRKLIAGFHAEKKFSQSIPLMVEYLKEHTEQESLVRLKLAEILIRHEKRPGQARKVLEKINGSKLNAKQTEYRQRLEQAAGKLRPEDVMEMEPEDW